MNSFSVCHPELPTIRGRMLLHMTQSHSHASQFRPRARNQLVESSEVGNIVRTPRSISEIDNGKIFGVGAKLAKHHPVSLWNVISSQGRFVLQGYMDPSYKQRREMISDLAKEHQIGTPIPRIEYTAEEQATWKEVYLQLKELYTLHACKEFNECFAKCQFSADRIPQLEDISQYIKNQTGWQIRPVAGLMDPRDFLNGFAFKTFHSTQYLRHHSKPMYTPEPDLVHEILGHVALLTNPDYCHMMQMIGLASLGASEEELLHLTKVYWYTIEFGVVNEGAEVKAFGAGILSSFGELQWMAEGHAKIGPFNPYLPLPDMCHNDGFQKQYFALQSFKDGSKLLSEYAMSRTQQA